MKVELETYLEFPNGGYVLIWKDTLCSQYASDWDYLQKRPYELYCYVVNRNQDTLGYYNGLSSPRRFTYYQITEDSDSLIELRFSIGINHFSEFLGQQSEEYIDSLNADFKEKLEFHPVPLDLRTDAKKKFVIELINVKNQLR